MSPILVLPLAVLLIAQPLPLASGQDILKPLGDLVEDLLPQRQTAPAPRPKPPSDAAAKPAAKSAAEPEAPEPAPPPLPRPRPDHLDAPASPPEPVDAPAEPDGAAPDVPEKPVEQTKETRVYQHACPAVLQGVVVAEMLPPIAEGICGEQSPLAVSAVRVNGHEIGFASPVTTNCAMAGALAGWIGEVDAYAAVALKSPVQSISSGPGLVCRHRNNAADGLVSEHGFADALDVLGFTLANGETITVSGDWLPASGASAGFLRQAHGAACSRFTTVLGPDANADHRDHFHLDLGCHGRTCTAQICE